MTKELQQFEKMDLVCRGMRCLPWKTEIRLQQSYGQTSWYQCTKQRTATTCNWNKMQEQLVLLSQWCIGKVFCCNTPAYTYPLFKTHKLREFIECWYQRHTVRLQQSVRNISTWRVTALSELILKPISTDFYKNIILSRQPVIHWRPAQSEWPPYQNSRN